MWYMDFDDACGAYSVYATPDGYKNSYGLMQKDLEVYKSFDVRPTSSAPVVYIDESGKPKLELMKWGFELERKTPPHKMLLFNTRDSSAFNSNFWKGMISKRR